MEILQLIFILPFLALSSCERVESYFLDESELNTECNRKSGEKGFYRLENECKTTDEVYSSALGDVVCCSDSQPAEEVEGKNYLIEIGRKSKDYCTKHVFRLDSYQDTHNWHIVNGADSNVGEFPHMAATL